MNARLVLVVSLAANLILSGAVGYLALRRPGPAKSVPRELRIAPAIPPVEPTPVPTPDSALTPAPVVEAFTWAQLVAPDFKVYRDRLWEIGCPEKTVRDILRAEIIEHFRPQQQKIVAEFQQQYWDLAVKGEEAFEVWEDRLEEIEAARKAMLTEVLGETGEDEPGERERRSRSLASRYDWLPAEQQDRLVQLELEFQERQQTLWAAIRQNPDGRPTAADQKRLKALQEELKQSRQQVLTPDEFLEYRLRTTSAGDWGRNLTGFEPTESEWRAVAKLRLNHLEALRPLASEMDEASRGRYGPSSPEAEAQRLRAEAELQSAIATALGPARFAEFQQAESSDYRITRRILARHGLPDSLAQQTYEIQRTAATQAEAVRTDLNLSAEARTTVLAAIRQETERTLTTALGERVFSTYQEYHGDWLEQLDHIAEK